MYNLELKKILGSLLIGSQFGKEIGTKCSDEKMTRTTLNKRTIIKLKMYCKPNLVII